MDGENYKSNVLEDEAGNKMIYMDVDNAEECQIKCQETAKCVGIMFARDGKGCRLKSIIPISSPDKENIGTVSGPKYCGNLSPIA